MADPLFWHRLQFGFTATFHYIFPQLTMGLALLIVLVKARALRTGCADWSAAARFWTRIFGLSFSVGVVTGIPLEFQFGTNWAVFSERTGGVIGQTLAMEGLFAFFLESSFLALLVYGERRLSPKWHFAAAVALFVGSWLSGYFVIATDAFMQHPRGYTIDASGNFQVASLSEYLFNSWAIVQFLHNQMGSVVTGSFAMAAVGAWWTLRGEHAGPARVSLRVGVIGAFLSSVLVAFPTGDLQGKLVAEHQPVALAAMEGRFESGTHAALSFIGQPDVEGRKLDNPIRLPGILSLIAYGSFSANVRGLEEFPERDWPTNIELLYYSFHVMAGLGTLFIALSALALLLQALGRLERARGLLWLLALAFPFPFIANTAGWLTAELGRQPWLVYGLMRTAEGGSPTVHGGATLFTTLGFAGLYFVLGLLYLALVAGELRRGPAASHAEH